ncbi:MAG: LPS-assembly protein LptD [Bdellovibrionales bacterium]|nr:LPS-assembly protein LptD [Bdellovibrionales bacterium]
MTRILAFLAALLPVSAMTATSFEVEMADGKQQITADRTVYHSREKIYEAFDHVVVSGKGMRLAADYVWVDTATQNVRARGNVVYVTPKSTITAAEIHYNAGTGLGTIFYGRVVNDYYTLKGQLIRKISDDRFLTTEGEYTTCRDCAESWKFTARNVDLTFDGYAFMDNVYVKVKDVPTLYLPYLVVPVKTKRQSGLLFPRITTGSIHGVTFVQPLFLALGDHQDATIGVGRYTSRGSRYELEHRYMSHTGVAGRFNGFLTKDGTAAAPTRERWSVNTAHEWGFFKNLGMRWRVLEVSDQEYPRTFVTDIIGDNLASMESNAVVGASLSDVFVAAEARRYRNLLYDRSKGFDGGTVQGMPTVHLGVKERRLAGPVHANFYGRLDNYTRRNGPFQDENRNGVYDPGEDTLRETRRLMLAPELAAPFRMFDVLAVSPSVQFNELRYFFDLPTQSSNLSNTSQRYLHAKLDTSVVTERVFQYDGKRVSRVKHQMAPFVNYSYIPWIDEDPTHPFQQQLRRDGGLFDQYDVIPLTNSTNFLRHPFGNSLTYGFTSRLIRKFRSPDEMPKVYPYDRFAPKPKEYGAPKNRKQEIALEREMLWDRFGPRYRDYEEVWTVTASQAYDFKDAKKQNDKKRAYSFFLARSGLNIDDFSHSVEYKFYPRIVQVATESVPERVFSNKHTVSTSATWYLKKLANARGTRTFERSISVNFSNSSQPVPSRTGEVFLNWSFNDFMSVGFEHQRDFLARKRLKNLIRTTYTSPSECWRLGLSYSQRHNTGTEWGFDLGINLMGQGYVGLSQFGAASPSGGG